MFRRIGIRHRVVIGAVVLALGGAAFGGLVAAERSRRAAIEQRRLAGLHYVVKVRDLLEQVERHRTGSVRYLAGDADAEGTILAARDAIDRQIRQLDPESARVDATLGVDRRWRDIVDRWQDLRVAHFFQKPEESLAGHTNLIRSLIQLARDVAYFSDLDLPEDPRYYLSESMVIRVLPLTDALTRAQALTEAAAARNKLNASEKTELLETVGQVKELSNGLADSARALDRSDPWLEDELAELVVRDLLAVHTFTERVEKGMTTGERPSAKAADTRWAAAFHALVEDFASPSPLDFALAAQDAARGVAGAFKLFDAAHLAALRETQRCAAEAARAARLATAATGGLLVFGLALSAILAWRIQRQTDALRAALAEVAHGDLQQRLAVDGIAEFADIAVNLNAVLDRQEAYVQANIDRHLGELHDKIELVASGDFTREAEIATSPDDALATAFNTMVAEMRKVIGAAKRVLGQVSPLVIDMKYRAMQLGDDSTTQITQLARVQQTVGQWRQSASSPRATREGTPAALASVRERVRRIHEQTAEIRRVTALMGEVAESTCNLSSNAALHAGMMAGDAGRGFAVVAQEVQRAARRLSDRASELVALGGAVAAESHAADEGLNKALHSNGSADNTSTGSAPTLMTEPTGPSADFLRELDAVADLVHSTTVHTQKILEIAGAIAQHVQDFRQGLSGVRVKPSDDSLSGLVHYSGELLAHRTGELVRDVPAVID